ncbi:MAG: outer membrane protein assembly factor BamA [Deltaproteobacteria bacterium]|nr:outer membrane protein assembly factor BamA [Deltaproteobacteria bacterium]
MNRYRSIIFTKIVLVFFLLGSPLFFPADQVFAEEEIITKIEVKGNKRIEADAILSVIDSRVGDYLSKEKVSQDIKNIFKMGYFGNVKVDLSTGDLGPLLTITVEERPFISSIAYEGWSEVTEESIKEVVHIKPYTIFSEEKVREAEKKLEELYEEKGFFLAHISHRLEVKNTETVLVFDIKEGKKVKIKRINLLGNKKMEDKKLLALMETKEGGFFSWLTESGKFEEETLQKDVDLLTSFYYNNGFVQIRIDEPRIFMSPDKKWLYVTIRIEEGEQFSVGKISFAGDLLAEQEEDADILESIRTGEGEIFSRDNLRIDVLTLTDRFGDKGYAFANIFPKTDIDEEKKLVDLTFNADKGRLVNIGRINVSGNTKTKDKVIRREMKLDEGDIYNGSALRRSRQRIFNLGYFKEANVNTKPSAEQDKLDIDIDIEEGPTGTLSVGLGYSSVDGLVGMLQVSQGNLFGRGQKLSVNAEKGGESSSYSISFTEPYLFDSPFSAGIDLFDNSREYDEYKASRRGWGLRTGRAIGEYSRVSLSYSFKDVSITDVAPTAPQEYRDYRNKKTSSIGLTVKKDTRDNYMNPTEGSENSLFIEYADTFGGDTYYYKTIVNSSFFFPSFSDDVIMVHGRIGYAGGLKGQPLHIDEKFRLGGINTLRGFDYRSVGPKEDSIVVGGNKVLLFNIEYVFDIAKDAGLKGLFFYDAGNAYSDDENYDIGNLRESVGYGFRWYSPVGPLRLEWGKVIDPEPGEKDSQWEFSIGTFF